MERDIMTPPLPDSERSRRIYPLLQNQDLENVSQATLKSVGDPISIENLNEDELRKLVLVNLARLSVKGEWNGLLTAASSGGGTPVFVPFQVPDGATTDEAFIPTAPIASDWGFSGTYTSTFDTPSHYPFYSGSFTEVEEMAVFFTGAAGTAGTTGSLAIYTLSTASDAGWKIGRPMAKVANSEMSFACDTGGRVEITPSSTLTLDANTWYSVAIVGDQSFATYPTAYRAFNWMIFWGNPNYGGLKASGETNYTLPATYSTSTTWAAATTIYSIPKIQWRGTN